ncbi:MAG: RNA-binding protein [Rhodocyclaceae bacterium]|nr:RNA-binding protein [Rhodocyclaceae bacterium]
MYFILGGLQADTSVDLITEGLRPYLTVTGVELIREGDADRPMARVCVDDSYTHVWETANRLRGIYHRGRALTLYIPAHQHFDHLFDAAEAPDDPREAIHLD